MITYLCAGLSSLVSLVLCFPPPKLRSGLRPLRRGACGGRLSTRLRDWGCCEGCWVVAYDDDDEWMVRMRVWFGTWEDIITFDAFLHALRMQTTAKLLGSPDPFIFYFPPKLIRCWPWPAHIWWCANFLPRSGVVGDSWFADLLSRMPMDWRLVKLRCYK
jgi:hypothetical protein